MKILHQKTKYFISVFIVTFVMSCSQIEFKKIPSPSSKKESPSLSKTVSQKPKKEKKNLWRGIEVADENKCSPYNKKKDYDYPDLEDEIIKKNLQGRHYSPYTGEMFNDKKESQIEHIVSTGEAHRSGLCAADRKARLFFASDLRNLTLASGSLNSQKRDKDAAEWVPNLNKCWFVWKVVKIKRFYGLTVDKEEKKVLEDIFRKCGCDKRWGRHDKEC